MYYIVTSSVFLTRDISRLIRQTHCTSNVNVSDCTEDFEDSPSLAKWSSLDLLAEGEDTTVRTPPAANAQGEQIFSTNSLIYVLRCEISTLRV